VSDRFDFFRLIFVFLGVIWPESCFGCEFSFLPLFLGPRVRLCSHTRSIERNSFSFSCFGSSVVPLPHNLFHTDLFWLTFSPKVQFGFAARLESSLQAITRGHFPHCTGLVLLPIWAILHFPRPACRSFTLVFGSRCAVHRLPPPARLLVRLLNSVCASPVVVSPH
jgi:hypothetical protein